MSNRMLRINELVQREISAFLHTRYKDEAVGITITGVVIAPDLHDGRVYYAVVGPQADAAAAGRWLAGKAGEIRHHVGRTVVMKFVPKLTYQVDNSSARAGRLERLLNELDAPPAPPPP